MRHPPPVTLADLLARAGQMTAHLGLARPAPFDESADDDPRAFLWWLLRMAETTARREAVPPPHGPEPALVARLRALLAGRPAPDANHAQMSCDAASVLRRAAVLRELAGSPDARVLAVGDDDAVTVALALLGHRALAAVDVDGRLLEWLEATVRSLGAELDAERVDVFEDDVPSRLAGACDAVVTDPPRSHDECLAFLRFGARCLRGPDARLGWADHPDWNFEHAAVTDALGTLGLRVERVIEDLQAYPLSDGWLPDAGAKARQLGVDAGWLGPLLRQTRAWTHLYVLAPAGTGRG